MSTSKTTSVVGVALALAAAGCLDAAQADKGTEKKAKKSKKQPIEAKADEILKKMSADLAATRSFTADVSHVHEVVTDEGEKIQVLAQAHLTVQRPDKLRSDRTGALADLSFYYDGKHATIYGKKAKLYATAKAPANIDEMIDFTRDELGLEAPGADLLYADVYSGLMEETTEGMYLGTEPVGDRTCHHLAFRGKEVDWQIWVEEGGTALPCRYVITSKKVDGQPQYEVELSNWDTSPALSSDTFTFKAPDGAEQIDFMTAKKAKGKGKTP